VFHFDAQMNFKLLKHAGMKKYVNRCWGIWVAIVGEIWNMNKCIFKNGRVDLLKVFIVAQRKSWSWVTTKERLTLLFGLVFGSPVLYEVFEKKNDILQTVLTICSGLLDFLCKFLFLLLVWL